MSAGRKRFYEDVTVKADSAGFSILLDGRTLKTPGKLALITDSKHIADLIAKEWDAQIQTIKPETMPVTRLVNVAIELTPSNRGPLVAQARSYGETDMLCYRADAPEALVKRQASQWDPVLNWAKEQGVALETTPAIQAITQAKASLDRIADYADGLNDLDLTLLSHLTAVFGSVVLAMAVMEKHLSGDAAFSLSRLDNDFQIENWGEDEEAAEATRQLRIETNALCKILEGGSHV